MPIPTQTDMFHVVLELMQDGEDRNRSKVRADVAATLNLTEDEREVVTSSGVPAYACRANWAVTYLDRAKLLDRVSRGVYRINGDGREVYASGVTGSELFQIIRGRIDRLDPWNITKKSKSQADDAEAESFELRLIDTDSEKSPQEQMGDLAEEMNVVLGKELLALIMEKDPSFFERVVVDLMEAMGYGKGRVTSRSNDGGVDGMISTDELGFRPIYTQAKRYQEDHKIGRPTVQSFVGALNGARNGVFITTSSFTQEAIDYALSYPNATLSLIDGRKLTSLMIKYNLGVATESVIEIKRVDSDYFEDE